MTFPEKRLYIVLIWLARQYSANEYDTTGLYLKSLTGLNDRALKKAMEGLESRWLTLDTAADPTIRHIHIALRNPVTRELLSEIRFDPDPRNNACNYYEEYKEGESKRANLLMPLEIAKGRSCSYCRIVVKRHSGKVTESSSSLALSTTIQRHHATSTQ